MSMTLLPVVLCLLSAVTVAATNMFVKRGGDVLTARMAVAIVMGLSVLPFAPFVPTRRERPGRSFAFRSWFTGFTSSVSYERCTGATCLWSSP